VVRVDEPDYPGFCRVIWQAHVREMSDLSAVDRHYLMEIVVAVESLLRRLYSPEKINLASFGNMTPHVHWHVIPRWLDDKHFPQPVWGLAQRESQIERRGISPQIMAGELAKLLDPIENQRRGGV
jgi:diadenosine tetraphosphate (Ap4A) HIT family hydrolase